MRICEEEGCWYPAQFMDKNGYVVCEECMDNDIHEGYAEYKDFEELTDENMGLR